VKEDEGKGERWGSEEPLHQVLQVAPGHEYVPFLIPDHAAFVFDIFVTASLSYGVGIRDASDIRPFFYIRYLAGNRSDTKKKPNVRLI
jgi:hypothetical protein